MFPSADIVTEIPSLDRGLDRLAQLVLRNRPSWPTADRRIVVLGFPRSANTFLTYWLRDCARADVIVLDGRLTHSALDVFRLSEAGAIVITPVRPPDAAVASWMVRRGRPGDPAAAVRKLRAYAAWHRVAAKALGSPRVVVIPFDLAISAPEALAEVSPLADLLGGTGLRPPAALVEAMEGELAGEGGQGVGGGDVPAAWMISLPRPERAEALQTAQGVLRDPSVQGARDEARTAFDRFMRLASQRAALSG